MADYIPVPVSEAKSIAERFLKSQVVILTWDPVHELMHTTTYGVTAFEKENAAATGAFIAAAVGSDLSKKMVYDDFHEDYDPALLREAQEILLKIRNQHGTSPHILQRIEQWCKASGHGLRQG